MLDSESMRTDTRRKAMNSPSMLVQSRSATQCYRGVERACRNISGPETPAVGAIENTSSLKKLIETCNAAKHVDILLASHSQKPQVTVQEMPQSDSQPTECFALSPMEPNFTLSSGTRTDTETKVPRKTPYTGPFVCNWQHKKARRSASKTVHFDTSSDQVRYFSTNDKPLIVGMSPSFETYDSLVNEATVENRITSVPHWWISMPNFPTTDEARRSMPIRVERVYFSNRRKALFGFVIVANWTYEKTVACRFTRDYWKTVNETTAQYYRPRKTKKGQYYDKFVFGIQFSEKDILDASPLFFCVWYKVNDQVYWDNNNGLNFTLDFNR